MTTKRSPWHRSDDLLFESSGQLAKTATPIDVLTGMFADPRMNASDFLGALLAATGDELTLLGAVLDQDNQDLASRVVQRITTRIEIAVEVERRIRLADDAGNDDELYVVPKCSDLECRDFDRARPATAEDLGRRGYVKRSAAMRALNILVRDEPTETDHEPPVAADPESATIRTAGVTC